jgi:hypothetical protein
MTDLPYFNISKNTMANAWIYEMGGIQATLNSKFLMIFTDSVLKNMGL